MSEDENQVKMNRDFKGIWIPREIWLCEGLSIAEKALWAEINSLHDHEKGGCYASNIYLMRFMNVKERCLQLMISNLKSYGLVEQVSFNGRERIIKAILPVDGFVVCRAEVHKNAPLGCKIPHLSGAQKRRSLIYREQRLEQSIEPPVSPPISAVAESTKVDGVVVSSSSKPKKVKTSVEFSQAVEEMAIKMINIVMKNSPVYRPPENLQKLYEQVDIILNKDKQDPELLLKTFEWACADNEQRGDFKGWQSVICNNKRKGKVSNPAEIFRGHFSAIYAQMSSQPKRKFAPSSKEDEHSRAKTKEWLDGAL